jgi:hypothetical protein
LDLIAGALRGIDVLEGTLGGWQLFFLLLPLFIRLSLFQVFFLLLFLLLLEDLFDLLSYRNFRLYFEFLLLGVKLYDSGNK